MARDWRTSSSTGLRILGLAEERAGEERVRAHGDKGCHYGGFKNNDRKWRLWSAGGDHSDLLDSGSRGGSSLGRFQAKSTNRKLPEQQARITCKHGC